MHHRRAGVSWSDHVSKEPDEAHPNGGTCRKCQLCCREGAHSACRVPRQRPEARGQRPEVQRLPTAACTGAPSNVHGISITKMKLGFITEIANGALVSELGFLRVSYRMVHISVLQLQRHVSRPPKMIGRALVKYSGR